MYEKSSVMAFLHQGYNMKYVFQQKMEWVIFLNLTLWVFLNYLYGFFLVPLVSLFTGNKNSVSAGWSGSRGLSVRFRWSRWCVRSSSTRWRLCCRWWGVDLGIQTHIVRWRCNVRVRMLQDMRMLSSGKPAQHMTEMEADLEKAEVRIRLLFNDVQLLKDGRHLQAEQMYRRYIRKLIIIATHLKIRFFYIVAWDKHGLCSCGWLKLSGVLKFSVKKMSRWGPWSQI